jgi:tetratricopeptide (TPR) repeat protein
LRSGTKDAVNARFAIASWPIRIVGDRQITSLQETGGVQNDRDIPIGPRESCATIAPVAGQEGHCPESSRSSWATIAAAGLIVLAVIAAYSNSFRGVFVFDDLPAIQDNPSLRQVWPPWKALTPPGHGETVSGRPLLNFSLAVNYALGRLDPWGYHLGNLAIHVWAALLLFAIVRRTLAGGAWGVGCGEEKSRLTPRTPHPPPHTLLAFAIALLWAVHPLQTESVTYIVQRSESLAGLFYLLTLYCVIRGAEAWGVRNGGLGIAAAKNAVSPAPNSQSRILNPSFWYAIAVFACLAGMATKEVTVTAPLIVLLYDRTFLASTFHQALRRRPALYAALAATWGLLIALVLWGGRLGHSDGFGTPRVASAWSYFCTEPGVILHYLRLCFRPSPLCLDYAWPVTAKIGEMLPGLLVVGPLLAATIWGLAGGRRWGFLGAWFFLILAPTSTFFPMGDAAFEHRMYLPLAAVVAAVVLGGYALGRTVARRAGSLAERSASRRRRVRVCTHATPWPASHVGASTHPTKLDWQGMLPHGWAALGGGLAALVGLGLGILTFQRNQDYQSELSIWRDTVAKSPGNARARTNLGACLCELGGDLDEAIGQYRLAIELDSEYPLAHHDLGVALYQRGRIEEAQAQFQKALDLDPEYADACNGYGLLLQNQGAVAPALAYYRKALEINPCCKAAYTNLGNVLHQQGKFAEAIASYRSALGIDPHYAEAHYNLAIVLNGRGKTEEAMDHYGQALRSRPQFYQAHTALGTILLSKGKRSAAAEHFRAALRLHPDDFSALNLLAWLLATGPGESEAEGAEAVELARRAVQLCHRRDPALLDTLAAAYARARQFRQAIQIGQLALNLAVAEGNSSLAEAIRNRLSHYRTGSAYQDFRLAGDSASGDLRSP